MFPGLTTHPQRPDGRRRSTWHRAPVRPGTASRPWPGNAASGSCAGRDASPRLRGSPRRRMRARWARRGGHPGWRYRSARCLRGDAREPSSDRVLVRRELASAGRGGSRQGGAGDGCRRGERRLRGRLQGAGFLFRHGGDFPLREIAGLLRRRFAAGEVSAKSATPRGRRRRSDAGCIRFGRLRSPLVRALFWRRGVATVAWLRYPCKRFGCVLSHTW
jgi:hypothetical protein